MKLHKQTNPGMIVIHVELSLKISFSWHFLHSNHYINLKCLLESKRKDQQTLLVSEILEALADCAVVCKALTIKSWLYWRSNRNGRWNRSSAAT